MRIVFMGTSDFAIPSLKAIIQSRHEIVGVVSQPDKPQGRGRKIVAPPVKQLAQEHSLPVYQPNSIKTPEAIDTIKVMQPDLVVVVSFGQIIPKAILDYPLYGAINVHASLLPKYRGAAPIQRAIMNGEKVTGISIMFMDEGLDTGDIIKQKSVNIIDEYDYGTLASVLANIGAELLIETIETLQTGVISRYPQDDSQATYAKMITSQDELIKWSDPAVSIHNLIRALSPQPGSFTAINDTKLKIFRSELGKGGIEKGRIGEVIKVDNEAFEVQTGNGTLRILEVQKAGKRRMPTGEFLRGFPIKTGTLLGLSGE
ncbi:MAG: methionyl-tRNA formyltransferase [Syntrophomonadaceae bacterium]